LAFRHCFIYFWIFQFWNVIVEHFVIVRVWHNQNIICIKSWSETPIHSKDLVLTSGCIGLQWYDMIEFRELCSICLLLGTAYLRA
jgi:hypothetical protein